MQLATLRMMSSPWSVAKYRSGPRNAMDRMVRPLNVPPTLSTVWLDELGLSTEGLVTRLTLPFFRNPTYSLPSGPRATAVGRSPASPSPNATGESPANAPKGGWSGLTNSTFQTPPPPGLNGCPFG